MIEIIPDLPDNVVAAVAHGKVTGEDYETVLVPAIENRLKSHEKIGCFYQLAPDFSGFTAEAAWDDFKIGMRHLTAFERVAVVTDAGWLRDAVKLFGFLMPCPVKVFDNDQAAEARSWVAGA
jgi:SpoIIAA-like